ncbi:MAG: NifB/NifX family molybdenum-iron cluster-binding protein [Smithellaceae bacterium]
MKIALSVWKDCISTVFDAADQLVIVEKDSDGSLKRSTVRLSVAGGPARAMQLAEMGVGVLICGAISRPQEVAISGSGITVYPFVRGPVQEILNAYLEGRLPSAVFSLPGCHGQGPGARRVQGRGRNCRWKAS